MHRGAKLNPKLWNDIYIRLKWIRQQPPMSDGTADSAIYPLVLAGRTKITMIAISISAVFLKVDLVCTGMSRLQTKLHRDYSFTIRYVS